MTGTLLVASRKDGHVWLIDLASDAVRARVPSGPGSREIALSPDGSLAVVSNYGVETPGSTVTVIDVVQGRAIRTIGLGGDRRPHGIIWPMDGRAFVTSERTRSVLQLDVERGVVAREIPTLEQGSHMMAATADGRRGFVSSLGGAVTVLDLEAGEAVRNIPVPKGAEGMAVTASGDLWVAHRVANSISVLDATTLETVAVLPCAGYPIRLSLQRGGDRLLAACPKRAEVALFDTTARRELARVSFNTLAGLPGVFGRVAVRLSRAIPFGVHVHPAGRTAFVTHPKSSRLSTLELDTGRVVSRRQVCRAPDGMAWSPVGG